MRQFLFNLILLVLTALIANSCRLPCDGFPNEYLKWIPFAIGDTISYTDNIDTIEFVVVDFFKTEKTNERTVMPIMDIECNDQAYYETGINKNTGFKLKETVFSDHFSFEIELQPGIQLSFNKDSKYQLDENVVSTYFMEKEIDGIIYNDILVVDIHLINNNGSISKFILASGYGILEFYDSKTEKTWRLLKN
jgi:hypothetical protein